LASLVELAVGEMHLALAPEIGGSIARLSRRWRQDGVVREFHWLRPASAAALADRNPLGMASFPLVPFCNRIRDGRASFEGRDIRFPPNHPSDPSPHPLHGIGWLRPWTLEQVTDHSAELGLVVPASPAWPWHFSARQHFALGPQGLSVAMAITNDDTAAMPAGIGHHPYFLRTPGTRLTTQADAMWHADAEVLPTHLGPHPALGQLRSGVEIDTLNLDNNFTGWSREALVEWGGDALGPPRRMRLSAQAPLDYFVLYCPPGLDHFCAEPVSQCTDWLNLLPAHGAGPLGGARLAPGESLQARFTLAAEWS
jgi:aldose 1-epimerase